MQRNQGWEVMSDKVEEPETDEELLPEETIRKTPSQERLEALTLEMERMQRLNLEMARMNQELMQRLASGHSASVGPSVSIGPPAYPCIKSPR